MQRRMLKPCLSCSVLTICVLGLYSALFKNGREIVHSFHDAGSPKWPDTLRDDDVRTVSFYSIPKMSHVEIEKTHSSIETQVSGVVQVSADDHSRELTLEEFLRESQSSASGDVPPRDTGRVWIDLDQQDVEDDELFQRLVVVTAFSENHRLEVMGMIGTVQSRMPGTKIIAYDLGIDPKQLHTVTTLCNVELRPVEFKKYPSHVSNVMTYAWKIIIIKETLNEFGAIFWADASVRFQKSVRTLLTFAKEHHGYLSRIHSYIASTRVPIPHNYQFTQQKTFDYFGINKTEYAHSTNSPHIAANRQLIINSTTIQNKVMKPLYACALEKTCISPPGAQRGNHQFDASALMLVFYKYLPNEFNRGNDHLSDLDNVMTMHRLSDDWNTAKRC